MRRCGDCQYWNYGLCQRYPPMPMALDNPRKGYSEICAISPSTSADDWCGEFKQKTKELRYTLGETRGVLGEE